MDYKKQNFVNFTAPGNYVFQGRRCLGFPSILSPRGVLEYAFYGCLTEDRQLDELREGYADQERTLAQDVKGLAEEQKRIAEEKREREEREDLMVIIAATEDELTRLQGQNLSLRDLRLMVHYEYNQYIAEKCFESGKFGWFLVRRIQASSRRGAGVPNLMSDIVAAEESYAAEQRRLDAEAAERRAAQEVQRQREAAEAQRVEQERRERVEQVGFPVHSRLDNPELQYCPVCTKGGADTVLIEDEEKGTVDQQREKYKKYTLPCTHLLCKDCIIGIKNARDRAGLERDLSCPTCRVFFRLTQDF